MALMTAAWFDVRGKRCFLMIYNPSSQLNFIFTYSAYIDYSEFILKFGCNFFFLSSFEGIVFSSSTYHNFIIE